MAELAALHRSFAGVVGEVARPVKGLHEEGIGGILQTLGAHAARPHQLGRIGPEVNHSATLVHVQARAHPRVCVPELLSPGAI